MTEARRKARATLDADPDLASPEHTILRAYVKKNSIAAILSDG
jgi:hypothetical protein